MLLAALSCVAYPQYRDAVPNGHVNGQATGHAGGTGAELVGARLRDPNFPSGVLVALVHRDDQSFVPTGDEVIRDGDRLTIIGNPGMVESLRQQFGAGEDITPQSTV